MKLVFLFFIFLSQYSFASRPSMAIKFEPRMCVCKDEASIQPYNCKRFCANKQTNGIEMLFAKLKVSAEVSYGVLKNLHGWCNSVLPHDVVNPMCVLEAKTIDGSSIHLDVNSISNSLTANIGSLSYNEIYDLALIEVVSGARSKPIKFVKFTTED